MSVIERASVCTFDCPDTCSLSVTVDDGRITKVRGSEALPFTDGVICNKVAHDMAAFVHGPQRLLHPLRRTGPKGSGAFERITWDAALDEIHARTSEVIERWGPQAVTPLNYAGPHGMLAGDSMSSRFFHKLGATQLYRRSMCGGVRSEAWTGTYGAVPGCPPEFAADAKLNVVWGNNATVTNLHLVRSIRQSMRKGGRWWWSIRCAPRSPSRPTCIWRRCPAPTFCWPGRWPPNWNGWAHSTTRSSPRNVLGFDEFMAAARAWPVARAAAACGLREEQIVDFRPMAGRGRPAGIRARQRPGARPQRRQLASAR